MRRLQAILRRIDGRGYKAYKDLERQSFSFSGFTLHVDQVQADPFAAPSRFRVQVSQEVAQFPASAYSSPSRKVALRDFLVRAFHRETLRASGKRGSGASGRIFVDTPGQEVLDRSACQVNQEYVEVRFFVGLPAAGRRVLGGEAEQMLIGALPEVVRKTLRFQSLDQPVLWQHVQTCEDADHLRGQLDSLGLAAFVADDSILPRRSGVDDRPLSGAVPFRSPDSLRLEVILPNRGAVTGMGIHRGVTLIVGGGFHGKSTLLRALERGVYNHLPGDGRELVVTEPTAVKVRAEDGRSVVGVDISPFIDSLPGGVDTRGFSTTNASGSTSQAANIAEALEAGGRLLLVDEDTSATNFMIRDRRMQALVENHQIGIDGFLCP
ncbi:MAG: P-loop domain-containing protein, partial [Dehalococcoidia bacterium]